MSSLIPRSWIAVATACFITALGVSTAVRADVVGVGDVFPFFDDPETIEVENVPNLPQFGNTRATALPLVIVGGTNHFVGGTSTGQMTIDIPSDTDPLYAVDGYIGGNTLGLGQVRVLGLNSEWQLTRSLTAGWEGQALIEVAAGGRLQVLRTATANGPVVVVEDPDVNVDTNDDPTVEWDLILGAWEGSQGFAEIDGFASLVVGGNMAIGLRGQGRVDMTNGSRMITINKAVVGATRDLAGTNDAAIGSGYVMVDGAETRWNVGVLPTNAPPLPGGGTPPPEDAYDEASLTIGAQGRGTVEVRNKGWVRVETDTIIGDEAGSFGKAIVGGADSLLWTLDDLFVGNGAATGELHIDDQGVVRADGDGAGSSMFVGSLGLVELAGGTLVTPSVTSNGVIRGDGRIESAEVINDGDIRNAAGLANIRERLLFTGEIDNTENIESVGGEMEFQGLVTHTGPEADLVGINAIFRFLGGLDSSGGGEIFLEDTLIYMPSNQALTSAGSLTLWAGESTLTGNLELQASNALAVTLGSEYGRIEVIGDATIAGSVDIFLANDYLPRIGDSFEIIDADSLSGAFDTIQGGGVGAGFWQASYTSTSAILSYVADIVSMLTADFDGNGVVDGADLAIIEMNYGKDPATMADGDANGDGIVDGADLLLWQEQLGSMAVVPVSSPAAGAVPEPAGAAMALVGLAALMRRRRR